MSVVAAVVVFAFGLCLIAFPGVAFTKPAIAEAFLSVFASSARAHYVEQVFRLLVGAALVVRSPTMWQPRMFWLLGWAIVVSSAVLMWIPWQWHRRLGERVLPLLVRHLRLYAFGSFALGALLLYGFFAGAVSHRLSAMIPQVRFEVRSLGQREATLTSLPGPMHLWLSPEPPRDRRRRHCHWLPDVAKDWSG
jgi:hypothetical protein